YTLNTDALYLPTLLKLSQKNVNNGTFEDAPYLYMNNWEMSEHIGTHIDAPVHFSLGGRMLHELTLSELHGPAVVVDIRKKAEKDPNAFLDITDIQKWEEIFGEIPKGAVIIQHSGWGQYWGDAHAYVGPPGTDGRLKVNSPGFHPDAVNWLLQHRDVKGFIVDSLSCESGSNFGSYPAHRAMLENDKWCVENAANVDKLPQKGSEVYVMAAKIENGSGGPVRMFAIWNEVAPWHNANGANGGAIISLGLLVNHFITLYLL
ncbi:unnamed protein product, partial [Owenia fusiformis]